MATETIAELNVQTVAELIHELGDIPPSRIWLHPTPGPATEKDVIEAEARFDRLCELVNGTLVEKGMGYFESRVAVVLIVMIERFLENSKLGIVAGESGMMRLA